jgi:hypothetical protein
VSDKYILVNGVPTIEPDLMKWAKWFETSERRVALTNVADAHVSTIFLGLDLSFGSGPPLLYETVVFGGALKNVTERYATAEEARRGHEAIVERVRNAYPANCQS